MSAFGGGSNNERMKMKIPFNKNERKFIVISLKKDSDVSIIPSEKSYHIGKNSLYFNILNIHLMNSLFSGNNICLDKVNLDNIKIKDFINKINTNNDLILWIHDIDIYKKILSNDYNINLLNLVIQNILTKGYKVEIYFNNIVNIFLNQKHTKCLIKGNHGFNKIYKLFSCQKFKIKKELAQYL